MTVLTTSWRIKTRPKWMLNFCNLAGWTVRKAYRGISDSINVTSVSVWQVDVINMQQLVRGRPYEANLLAKRAWYQFNFLMRWRPCLGLILFGVSYTTVDKLLSIRQTEFNACRYWNNLLSERTVLTPAGLSMWAFMFLMIRKSI